jgi:cell division protein FtsW (lipid II flippase)
MKRIRQVSLGDPLLFLLVTGLAAFGVAMIYSAGVLDVPSTIVAGLWRQQLLWFVLAMLATPLVLRSRWSGWSGRRSRSTPSRSSCWC